MTPRRKDFVTSTRRAFVPGFTKTKPAFLNREGTARSASFARLVRRMSRGSSVLVSSGASAMELASRSTWSQRSLRTSFLRIPVSKARRRGAAAPLPPRGAEQA